MRLTKRSQLELNAILRKYNKTMRCEMKTEYIYLLTMDYDPTHKTLLSASIRILKKNIEVYFALLCFRKNSEHTNYSNRRI